MLVFALVLLSTYITAIQLRPIDTLYRKGKIPKLKPDALLIGVWTLFFFVCVTVHMSVFWSLL